MLFYLHKRGAPPGRTFVLGIILIYALLIINLTLLPIRIDQGYNEWARSVNWRHFVTISMSGLSAYLSARHGIGNILMGIPFGILFPFASVGATSTKVLVMSLTLSSGIEIAQLALNVSGYAFPFREIDSRDVVCNVLGAMIGFAVFWMLSWRYRGVVQAPPHQGKIWRYFHLALTRQRPPGEP
ncbi:VanZ family protein [Thermaerobacter litoralis]